MFIPTMMDFSAHERATNLSVDDVVKFCKDSSYVVEELQPSELCL